MVNAVREIVDRCPVALPLTIATESSCQSAYATRIRNCDAFDFGGYDSGAFWHAYGLMSTVELASAGLIRYLTQTRAIRWSILVLALLCITLSASS